MTNDERNVHQTQQEVHELRIDKRFETWQREVYGPDCSRNREQHDEILNRLKLLNGWHNKILGAMAVLGAMVPVAATIAAIVALFKGG